MSRRSLTCLALALCGVGLVALANGCGSAQAEPMDVTYYYLPG